MTAPGRVMRCDYAGCHQPGTVEHEAWVFCREHANAGRSQGAAPAKATPRPAAPIGTRPAAPVGTRPAASALGALPIAVRPAGQIGPAPTPQPSPIALLLEQASAHSSAKVRRVAEHIETKLDALRALIADLADEERKAKAEQAAAARARAEVERLEAELAKAKAALPARTKRAYTMTPAAREARAAALAKANAARAAKRQAATS